MKTKLVILFVMLFTAACSTEETPIAPRCPENVAVSVFPTSCPDAPGCATCFGESENGSGHHAVSGCYAAEGFGGALCVESCDACPAAVSSP